MTQEKKFFNNISDLNTNKIYLFFENDNKDYCQDKKFWQLIQLIAGSIRTKTNIGISSNANDNKERLRCSKTPIVNHIGIVFYDNTKWYRAELCYYKGGKIISEFNDEDNQIYFVNFTQNDKEKIGDIKKLFCDIIKPQTLKVFINYNFKKVSTKFLNKKNSRYDDRKKVVIYCRIQKFIRGFIDYDSKSYTCVCLIEELRILSKIDHIPLDKMPFLILHELINY